MIVSFLSSFKWVKFSLCFNFPWESQMDFVCQIYDHRFFARLEQDIKTLLVAQI